MEFNKSFHVSTFWDKTQYLYQKYKRISETSTLLFADNTFLLSETCKLLIAKVFFSF